MTFCFLHSHCLAARQTRASTKKTQKTYTAQLDPLGFGATAAPVSLMATSSAVGTAAAAAAANTASAGGTDGILPAALQCPAPFAFPFNPLGMGLFDTDPSRILAILHHQTLLAEEALR